MSKFVEQRKKSPVDFFLRHEKPNHFAELYRFCWTVVHCVVLYCKSPSVKREKIRVDVLQPVGERQKIRWNAGGGVEEEAEKLKGLKDGTMAAQIVRVGAG